jgi:CDP-diacylglycerol--serine O-phosphatidyltransferase
MAEPREGAVALRYRRLRYLAPNLVTGVGFVFGMLSLVASYEGRYVDAAWWIIYAVLTDRIDGTLARLVRGTSELGVQLDSLADFLNFGLCPAVLVFTALGTAHGLPFEAGTGRAVLMIACVVWVLGATYRLARFNITTTGTATKKIFFGVPTTLAAGLVAIWFLALAKYAGSADPLLIANDGGGGPKLFPGLTTPGEVWRYLPLVLFVGGLLMASNLRMPKLGLARRRVATAVILTNVFIGYVLGFARLFPEYLVWPPTIWIVTFLLWGQLSREARGMTPPRVFPPVNPPEEEIRPEDLLDGGDRSEPLETNS